MNTAADCSPTGRPDTQVIVLPVLRDGEERGKDARGVMAGLATTIRLASGIFYKFPQLSCAIDDLLASGFGRREMCLAGTQDALAGARAVAAGTPRRLRPLYPMPDGTRVMATSGVLLRKLLKEAAWRERAKTRSPPPGCSPSCSGYLAITSAAMPLC